MIAEPTDQNPLYDVLLVDFPWHWKAWSDKGNGRSACQHYDVAGIELGLQLGEKIKQLTKPNCVMFFWAIWPMIFEARPIIEAFGFTYRTLAWEWVKLNKSGIGWHIGNGYYTRSNVEPALLCVKGSMPVAVHNERNLLIEYEDDCLELPMITPVGQHSQKPDEQYHKIERLYPASQYPRRLELFARRQYPTWDVWGNQVESSAIPAMCLG